MRAYQSEEEYIRHIQSDAFNVSAERDKAVFYAGRNGFNCADAHFRYVGNGYLSIDFTQGGTWLERERLWGEKENYFGRPYESEERLHADQPTPPINEEAARRVWAAASKKYAEQATGAVTCVVDGASEDTIFRRVELPALINNGKVTYINGIERKVLKELYDADPTQDKRWSLDRAFDVIKREPLQISYQPEPPKGQEKEPDETETRRAKLTNEKGEQCFLEITGIPIGEDLRGLRLSNEHSRMTDELKKDQTLTLSLSEVYESIGREQVQKEYKQEQEQQRREQERLQQQEQRQEMTYSR